MDARFFFFLVIRSAQRRPPFHYMFNKNDSYRMFPLPATLNVPNQTPLPYGAYGGGGGGVCAGSRGEVFLSLAVAANS